ncbi:hypothetical protein [Sandarakinorhabdus rubra]|uniref:hypothetical protein n=1 Tax=Sandarakinorhabdus rubra TaxID=2672568 RepID=UPI0013DB7DE3|nr:hypothetical protein [Sandarakinorhabdus rubra]
MTRPPRQVPLSLRYGLIAIAGLALLSSADWLRGQRLQLAPPGNWLLGVAPNFAAAIAITFVLLGGWTDRAGAAAFPVARMRFIMAALVSLAGLIGWEFIQRSSNRFVFDPADMLATLVGIGVSLLLFLSVTPRHLGQP